MISTKRLILLPLSHNQLIKYVQNDLTLEQDLNVVLKTRNISPELKEALENTIIPNVADSSKNYLYSTLWTIIDKELNTMIGDLCLMGEPDEKGEVEIGYGTYESFQGKGYMTEAVGGMINWLKEQPYVFALRASTDKENHASLSVLKKNGFIQTEENETGVHWKLIFEKKENKNDPYKITFQTWNKIADIYQDKFMNMDIYDHSYDLFLSHLKEQASVFEIGCGPGNITHYLLSKKPGLKIKGTDVAPNMIALAAKNNPSASFEVMDCRTIDTLKNKFDAIVCGFCMPYLSKEDCEKLIADSSSLLYPEGIIYLSTIEGDYKKSGFESGSSGDKAYVYYHEKQHILDTLNKNNFDLLHLEKIAYKRSTEVTDVHLVFIARKK